MINIKNTKGYCCEDISKIENYEEAVNDKSNTWVIHHRLESEHELFRPTKQQLKNNGLYYNRPADELIFMKLSDHRRLHISLDKEIGRGISSNLCRNKISSSLQGNQNAKGKPKSDETRRKLSIANKGKVPTRRCIEAAIETNKANKGKHWFNNGVENKFCFECPEGFVSGMIHHTK